MKSSDQRKNVIFVLRNCVLELVRIFNIMKKCDGQPDTLIDKCRSVYVLTPSKK